MSASTDVRPIDSGDQDDEIDEQFQALLAGLRTSLPGVQVLFAFLLTAPFQTSFSELTGASRAAFTAAFFASGTASVLLIAPSVHQRLRAPASGLRRKSKRHLIIATWVTIAGTFAMGIAIVATVFLVTSVVFDQRPALAASGVIAVVLGWSWLYLPYVTFRKVG